MNKYEILVSKETEKKIEAYLRELSNDNIELWNNSEWRREQLTNMLVNGMNP